MIVVCVRYLDVIIELNTAIIARGSLQMSHFRDF